MHNEKGKKEDILKNFGNQTVDGSHRMEMEKEKKKGKNFEMFGTT